MFQIEQTVEKKIRLLIATTGGASSLLSALAAPALSTMNLESAIFKVLI